jgi:signal transduction histidine kinase
MIQSTINRAKKKFVVTMLVFVGLFVSITWGTLQYVNVTQIGKPADSMEVHSAAVSPEVSDYLEEQQAYEAHFITIASSIKKQERDRLTKALALAAAGMVVVGASAAFLVSRLLLKPVEEAYASQERFVQDAAHELRNPLAAMNAALQQADKSTKSERLLIAFRRQTNRLIAITEDLLFLERAPKDQVLSRLNLQELLLDIVEELQPISTRRNIKIAVEKNEKLHKMMASGDYIRLVKNALDNAIKYSRPDSKVTISQTIESQYICIRVQDNGIGIPASDLERIGDRFYRAANVGDVQGTGLGVAIIKKILHTYGGSFSIESVEKKGTILTLRLPS